MENNKITGSTDCFTPNNDPYPLCIGSKEIIEKCSECNLYEDLEGPYDKDEIIKFVVK